MGRVGISCVKFGAPAVAVDTMVRMAKRKQDAYSEFVRFSGADDLTDDDWKALTKIAKVLQVSLKARNEPDVNFGCHQTLVQVLLALGNICRSEFLKEDGAKTITVGDLLTMSKTSIMVKRKRYVDYGLVREDVKQHGPHPYIKMTASRLVRDIVAGSSDSSSSDSSD